MNIRPRDPRGKRPPLSPLQEVELVAWLEARKFLGTHKTKAHEFGISLKQFKDCIRSLRRREIR